MIEASQQPPDPTRCQCDDDVGRLYHDEALDIWPEFGATFPAEARCEPVAWASCG